MASKTMEPPVFETTKKDSISAYGTARSTIEGQPLGAEELCKIHAYWRACNYLSLGMIYLQENPLLQEPLKPEHIKNRLLGHWGASPGLAFIYIHLNRLIKKYDLNMIFLAGPGHQDHNGFTHQDPGFLDVVVNKSASVTRIYLPPDVNSLLSVADHCLRSENYVNVIFSDKQLHLQYMDMDATIRHCTKGIGIWDWASNDQGGEPDVVLASAGDIPTQRALAAVALLRADFPDLKIRYINVVDLFKLQPSTEHPHGLPDRDFASLFTVDKPIIFNFHGYPWLVHDGTPKLQRVGAHAKEKYRDQQTDCRNYAYEHGIDKPEIVSWRWPY